MAFTLHGGGSGSKRYQKMRTQLLLMTGGFLFLISLPELNATLRRNNIVIRIYLTLMFFLIVGLIVSTDFTAFAFLVTKDVPRKDFQEKGVHSTGPLITPVG